MDYRVLILILALIPLAFFAGRKSAPEKVRIETKIETKTEVLKDEHKAVATRESIVEITKPDGTKIRRVKTRTHEDLDTKIVERIIQSQAEKTEIETRKGVIVQGLVALKEFKPVYGAAFTKKFIGPVHVGAFLFTDLSVGLSLGWEF